MDRSVVIIGVTGFLGRHLQAHLSKQGWRVIGLKRGENGWDGKSRGPWESALAGATAIVNLAGAPITLPWTTTNRELILRSRVESTHVVGQALSEMASPPIWVNASAVGIYGNRGDELLTENSAPGSDFLAEVCVKWEAALTQSPPSPSPRIALRTGIVFGPDGGALTPLAKLARIGLGGQLGNGRQWMPWIHIRDHIRLVEFLIESNISGAVNAVGPVPVENREFAKILRQTVHFPIGVPTPAFALTAASKLGGPDPSVLLNSTRVVPQHALDAGFRFEYGNLASALADCLGRSP